MYISSTNMISPTNEVSPTGHVSPTGEVSQTAQVSQTAYRRVQDLPTEGLEYANNAVHVTISKEALALSRGYGK
jgi:hypothetical protein